MDMFIFVIIIKIVYEKSMGNSINNIFYKGGDAKK